MQRIPLSIVPAMLVAGMAIYEAWRSAGGARPALVAGHSLGEYTALTAAEALSLEEAVRLREKGGKAHALPCHHNLEAYLTAYLEQTGIIEDGKGPLFRTIGRGTAKLTTTPLPQANAYAMVARRAAAALPLRSHPTYVWQHRRRE